MDIKRWISMSEKMGVACRCADHPHTTYATWLLVEEHGWRLDSILNAACDRCKEKIVHEEEINEN